VKPNESPADSAPAESAPAESAPKEPTSPFPPAFRWETSPPEAPTQVMRAVGRDTAVGGPREAPQRVRSSPSSQQRPDEVRDLFQPFETPPAKPFGEPSDRSAPPWAETGLPPSAERPIADQQNEWLRRHSGGFTASAMQSRSKQIIGITVLAVVLLGLVGATVAYFLTTGPDRSGNDQIAAPQPGTAPRALPAPPALRPEPVDTAHALIDPPGHMRGGGGPFDLPKLEATEVLPAPILSVLRAGGMTDAFFKTTTVGTTTIGMFALTLPDQQAATTVAQKIATAESEGGLKADDSRALQGVAVMGSVPASTESAYRAVYVLYKRVIFFEVLGADRSNVLATFDSLIKQQVADAPPTVR
jgi:hypothetical protein